MLNDAENGAKNWASKIRDLLNNHGFTYVWERQHVLDLKDFHFLFKKRVIDECLQKWYNDMNTCHYLPMLKHYKINFGYEMYLDILPPKLRNILTKLRLSSHKLRIESDRYNRNRTPRELRYCTLCNVNDVEDEYRFVLVCPAFIALRKKYIQAYYYRNPSAFKFCELLKTDKKNILYKLSKYLYEAFILRKSFL